MSLAAAVARVQEIQRLVQPPVAVQPAAPVPTSFAAQLAGAGAATPTTAAAAPAAPGAGGVTLATAGTGKLPAGTPFAAQIEAAAAKHGLDPALLAGLIRQESNFNPNAGSPAGARGLTQLMPGTAAGLGVTNVLDPAQSIDGGARYLRQMLDRFGGDVTRALAGYNAGPGAVARFGGVPPYAETQHYLRQVQAYAAQYRSAAPAAPAAGPTLSAPIAT